MKSRGERWTALTRRRFLAMLGLSGAGATFGRSNLFPALVRASSAAASLPAFEEVPPAASGISWTHVGGHSPQLYLPETLGPGCAFLDYDNDGWMDIYLVNSGPCDFYTPPQ